MMTNKKISLTIGILALLLVVVACEFFLHSTSGEKKKQESTQIIFIGKNKSLESAKVKFINTAGDTIAEKELDDQGKTKDVPIEDVYLKINQKESNDEL